jgi:tellurite resistance protein TerC
MPPPPPVIPLYAWVGFGVLVLFVLALDLGIFHKEAKALTLREAAAWCGVWVSLAATFGVGILLWRDTPTASVYAAGYLLELSLSVDNLFVFLLVFSAFKVPAEHQHRVLFWGILGAVLARALFIFGGIALVERFGVLMYVFGIFLIATGIKMLFPEKQTAKDVENKFLVRTARRFFPMTPNLRGHHFFVREGGRLLATPLFLVLLVIEGTDIIFAADSIPAIMGILPPAMDYQNKIFVALTSNIFAILGLRSLYFALAGLLGCVRYLKYGLATMLAFIGVKMLLGTSGLLHIPPGLSVATLATILASTIATSLFFPPKGDMEQSPPSSVRNSEHD